MSSFVLIGGGEIALGETLAIDRAVAALPGKERPRLLFIPTASGDPEGYVKTVAEVYGGLGCDVGALLLARREPSAAEIEDQVGAADLVYVGGGDTRFLVERWRATGLDRALAARVGDESFVFAGLSAGSMCWFARGVSDTESFKGGEAWNYSLIECLGFIDGCHSPHLDEREAERRFMDFVRGGDYDFLGIENGCAVILEGDSYRLIRSIEGKGAYRVRSGGGSYDRLEVPNEGRAADLGIALISGTCPRSALLS